MDLGVRQEQKCIRADCLDDEVADSDQIGEFHGVRVAVDRMSAPYLSDAKVDFVGETIGDQAAEAARLMGINVDTTISLTFLIGGMLAGSAGIIYALYQTTIWYFQGFTAGLVAFTAAVMGGIGNIRGAVLGGIIIGFLQQISDNRIGSEWTPAIVFVYLILIMVFKPSGLLGEETREAG